MYKCVNCINANKTLKLNLDENHHAFSPDCECLKKRLEQKKRIINFNN